MGYEEFKLFAKWSRSLKPEDIPLDPVLSVAHPSAYSECPEIFSPRIHEYFDEVDKLPGHEPITLPKAS